MLFTADALVGRRMLDKDGEEVGSVTAWYRYPQDLNAEFGVAAVRTGRVLRSRHLVDLLDASLDEEALTVVYPAALIGAAPYHEPLIGDTLSDQHAADVLAHYRASMAPA
jgi:hypothetical protein